MSAIRAILWDFGDTLADERWMLAAPEAEPRWARAWLETMDALGPRWSVGAANSADIAADVAGRLGWPTTRAMEHMRACCGRVEFFPAAMALAAESRLPQALVTVNSDIFNEVVAPAYGLETMFPVIVASWQEGLADKAELAAIAMRRLGADLTPTQCLLIDNLAPNIEAWRAAGGVGHHFTSPEDLTLAWAGFPFAADSRP